MLKDCKTSKGTIYTQKKFVFLGSILSGSFLDLTVLSAISRIEKMLRDKIMTWRPRFVTRWNRCVTASICRLRSPSACFCS